MTAGFDTGTSHDDWVVVPRICDFMGENMADPSQHQQNELKIVSYKPAEFWTDAFPVGNGRLGAMIWGGVQSELLQLNEDTLWSGEPSNFTDPNVLTILPEVRKLVREGHYAQASITANKMAGQPTEVYKPLGDIKLDFGASHKDFDAESYERELDLDTAKATVKYVANGVEFVRETFTSNPQQLIAIKLSANKAAALSFTVSLDSPLHYDSQASGQNRIIMQGYCPWTRNAPQISTEETKKGTRFCAILEVQISSDAGAVSIIEGNKLKVDGSNWAVLLLSAASSFDGPFVRPENSQKDPVSAASATLSSVKGLSFSQLYTNHLLDYQSLFHRVTLKLSRNSNDSMNDRASTSVSKKAQILPCMEMTQMASGSKVSTADRVTAFAQDEDPALVTLLFQYGRYLLISSSRPGTQVSNLQGIWSQKVDPAWDAAPHLNINLQMNYWPAISCNLAECQEPLFELISNLAINGSKTSQVNYQTGGWVTHHVTDIWAKTSPSDGDAKWSIWPMGGAWLCTHLWEYYAYTRDMDFLKEKAYPLLKGCATFLYDWLLKEIDDILVTNPSTSPEHEFVAPNGEKASVSYATAMDMAIIREIFSAVISAAKILGNTDEEFIAKLKDAQPKLFPPRISRDGSLMEWAQDFEDPEPQHRHMSHLFGLYPGHTITKETTPELCIAAEKSLIKRGEDGPGWSTVWKTSLWARLGNSEHAYRMVKKLITLVDPTHEEQFEGGLYANLFTAHPPFQIDANFGFSAAIAEILVQSNETELFFLPALPKDKWPNGCVQGLKARGHVSVSICWKGGKMIKVGLVAENQHQQRNLHYNGMSMQVTLLTGFMHIFSTDLKKIKAVPLSSSTTELRASKSSSCSIL